MISFIGESKENNRKNLFMKQKQTHRVLVTREQTYGYQREGWWGRKDWEFWIDMYTMLYIKQITNRDLFYSTGNSAQYPVLAYMGKESKKEWIYV